MLRFADAGRACGRRCVAERTGLAPLLAALAALVAWLDATRTRSAIIGGVAASLLGRPRVTGDVDALVLVDDDAWQAFVAAGAVHGIRPRRSDAIAFAGEAGCYCSATSRVASTSTSRWACCRSSRS